MSTGGRITKMRSEGMGSKNRFQKPLECVLSEHEKIDYSKILADKCVKRAGLLEEKKAVSAGFNQQIKEIDEIIEQKSLAVHNGSEIRDVMCHYAIDRDSGKAELIREDTGEIVETRALTAQELQEDLFGE